MNCTDILAVTQSSSTGNNIGILNERQPKGYQHFYLHPIVNIYTEYLCNNLKEYL